MIKKIVVSLMVLVVLLSSCLCAFAASQNYASPTAPTTPQHTTRVLGDYDDRYQTTDAYGNIIDLATDPNGVTYPWKFDANGNIVYLVDINGESPQTGSNPALVAGMAVLFSAAVAVMAIKKLTAK